MQKYYDFFFYINNKNKINIIHVFCYLQFIQKLLMHVNKKIYKILIIFLSLVIKN